jgi:F-type H+-transporting ATPase subunit epsilon
MSSFYLTVVTPEEEIFSDEVDMVTVETDQGELGILPNHTNILAQIIPGDLRIKKGTKVTSLATGGGLLQMNNNKLSIITDMATTAESINEKEAEEARDRAKAALQNKLSEEEYADTLAILERSISKLKVKRRHKGL